MAGSLTVSSGVVYLLAGLGESFRDISGRQTPTIRIFNSDQEAGSRRPDGFLTL